jgi:NAD(P)-dependent dehydrogenase (short-subunit alcohol dehydrogenase family)
VENLATQVKQTRDQFEQEFFKSIRPSSLLKRFERPEEIGAMAAFLCSPLASATNGAAVRVDGGVVRSIV